MTNPQPITEKDGLHVQWYVDAKTQTLETLPAFIDRLMTSYQHDYGTIVHAIAACMTATIYACDHAPQGGITGFQAGMMKWLVLRHAFHVEGPARIQLIHNLLYPQYESAFTTITKEDAEFIQVEAKKHLADMADAHEDVVAHWKKIADGWIPFGLRVAEEGE